MNKEMEDLIHEAVERAKKSGSLEDIERAASTQKLAAEAQKNTTEAATIKRSLRLEGLKSWAQILVPLISVLTLGATVLTQTIQQRSTQDAQEDAAWRTAIANFSSRGGKGRVDGLLAQVQLKPFLKSGRHKREANELAVLIMPEMADVEAFKDLFNTVDWQSLDDMVRVDRGLNDILGETIETLHRLDAPVPRGPKPGVPGFDPANQRIPNATYPGVQGPTLKETLEHQRSSVGRAVTFVCGKIAAAVRSGSFHALNLDLQKTFFYECDLSQIDFSGADLTDAGFQAVKLEGTRLAGITNVGASFWDNSDWWMAAEVSEPLLKKLIDEYYPGSANESDPVEPRPTKAQYLEQVLRLCKAANMSCAESSLKFTEINASP